MSWSTESHARELFARERTLFAAARGGGTGVCLAYPNRYALGMGNLGFQAVYRILATTPGHYCERAFLPEGDARLVTLESQRGAGALGALALSISFETDYLNVPAMLAGAGLPVWSRERNERHPLVIAGGSAIFLSPMPPRPKTAIVAPASSRARFSTAPTPVITPQPISAAQSKGTRRPTARALGDGTPA